MEKQYDYIICGAGLAGLSLAYRLCNEQFEDLKILLVDKDDKTKNDRTWCFWEKEKNIFESIVYKKWDQLDFYSPKGRIDLDIVPYRYKMIRGIDFYKFCLKAIGKSSHISILNANIQGFGQDEIGPSLITDKGKFYSKCIFNSALREKVDKDRYNYVDQHFKGWKIKTANPYFDPARATFMDFRIDQKDEARFFYVLPTSQHEALVEVAIFSNEVLLDETYDSIIQDYIKNYLKIAEYEVEEEEFGIIPMTSYPFKREYAPGVVNIGTSGGAVKASSGYAFKRIQEQCDSVLSKISKGLYPLPDTRKRKYLLLDSVLLNVVQTNKYSSAEVFHRLFHKHKASFVFKFLDEKTSLLEDLKIVSAPPPLPFMKAAFEEMWK